MHKSLILMLFFCLSVLFAASQAGSGNCLKFNGSNYVDCGNPAGNLFEFTGIGTIEAWVKVTSTPPPAGGVTCYSILAKDESAGDFNKWIFGVQDGKLAFHINDSAAIRDWVYSKQFTLVVGKYYHFAMTKNSFDEITFYVNGSDMGTVKLPDSTHKVKSNMVIGSSEPGLEMVGEVDEVRFWKRIVSQTDLRNWMCRKLNASHPAYPDLTANYRLNEGAGTTTNNYNGLASTLVNNPEWAISAVPIGDSAVTDFSNANQSASIKNLSGEQFSASVTNGMPAGIIIYRVDEVPNTVVGINSVWYNTNYFGVFIAEVNPSSSKYAGEYKYTGNPFVTPSNECSLKLYKRNNNADVPWVLSGSSSNPVGHSISLTGGNMEYLLAGDDTKKNAAITIAINNAGNTVCPGATVIFTATPTNGGAAPSYQWQLNGLNTSVGSSLYSGNSFKDKDIIQCVLMSSEACVIPAAKSSNSITLNVPVGIKLGNDTGFCIMDHVTLQVVDTFASYQWNTGNVTNKLDITKAGTYWAQAKDKYNCISADTINISEKYCGFSIPNAFTPNRDGHNDIFKPLLSGTIASYRFKIYNRWGEKIFSTNNVAEGWDGYHKNQIQSPGSYIWVCEFQLGGQPLVQKKGSVLLIR